MDEQQPQQNQNQPTPVPEPAAPTEPPKHGSYGKRPWWQWLLLYLVVGGIVYFLVYLIFFNGSAGDSGSLY